MARYFGERVFYCFFSLLMLGKERRSGGLRAGCLKRFFWRTPTERWS